MQEINGLVVSNQAELLTRHTVAPELPQRGRSMTMQFRSAAVIQACAPPGDEQDLKQSLRHHTPAQMEESKLMVCKLHPDAVLGKATAMDTFVTELSQGQHSSFELGCW